MLRFQREPRWSPEAHVLLYCQGDPAFRAGLALFQPVARCTLCYCASTGIHTRPNHCGLIERTRAPKSAHLADGLKDAGPHVPRDTLFANSAIPAQGCSWNKLDVVHTHVFIQFAA